MISMPVTATVAAAFAVMLTLLGFLVSLQRVKLGGVGFGDGGDARLRRRIRAHGNFAEYAPLGLICVGLLELQQWSGVMLATVAACFVGARAVHALGMLYSASPTPRAIAMVVQHLTFLVCAVLLVVGR